MKTKLIPIADVVIDETIYPRTHAAWQTIYDYQQSMKSGAKFPPIAVTKLKGGYLLVDGKHRIEAMKLNKEKSVLAEILQPMSTKEAYIESVRRNISHGRPITTYEKAIIITKLEEMGYNKSEISSVIQIPISKFDSFKASKLTWTSTGEHTAIKPALKHLAKKDEAIDSTRNYEQVKLGPLTQIAIVTNLVTLIENKWIDFQNKQLLEKLTYLKKLLNKYKSI